jgi:hypothetical protein
MPHYNLFLYNQHSRVRYPETFDVPDIEAAQGIARRVANAFMEVVPFWGDLSPEEQSRYVVEIVDETGGLLLAVPFKEPEAAKVDQSEAKPHRKKKALPDGSTDRAGKFQEE